MDRALAGLGTETYGSVGDGLPVRSPAGPLTFRHLLGLAITASRDSENRIPRVVKNVPPVRGPLKPVATVAKRQVIRHTYAGKRYDRIAVHRHLVERAAEPQTGASAEESYALTVGRKRGRETGRQRAIFGSVRVGDVHHRLQPRGVQERDDLRRW